MAKSITSDLDKFYIEEFLFRGRSKTDPRPTAWHLIIGIEGTDPVGRPHEPLPIMTSEQAIAAGWDIPAVVSEINTQVLAELEEERMKSAQIADEKAQLSDALVDEKKRSAVIAAERDALALELHAEQSRLAANQPTKSAGAAC